MNHISKSEPKNPNSYDGTHSFNWQSFLFGYSRRKTNVFGFQCESVESTALAVKNQLVLTIMEIKATIFLVIMARTSKETLEKAGLYVVTVVRLAVQWRGISLLGILCTISGGEGLQRLIKSLLNNLYICGLTITTGMRDIH